MRSNHGSLMGGFSCYMRLPRHLAETLTYMNESTMTRRERALKQTSPLMAMREHLQVATLSLRRWLIRVGIMTPSGQRGPLSPELTDEQQNAQRTLRFHSQ